MGTLYYGDNLDILRRYLNFVNEILRLALTAFLLAAGIQFGYAQGSLCVNSQSFLSQCPAAHYPE
jgi:hypothetical protein